MSRRTIFEKNQVRLGIESLEDRLVPAVGMNPALNMSGIGMNPALNMSQVGMQPNVQTNIAGGVAGVNLAKAPPVTTAMVGMQPNVQTNIAGGVAGVNLTKAPPVTTPMVGMQPNVQTNIAGQANKTGLVGLQPTPQSLAINQAVNNFYSGTGSYADFLASLGVGKKPATTFTPPTNPNSNPFFASQNAQLSDASKRIFMNMGVGGVNTLGDMYAKGQADYSEGEAPTVNDSGDLTSLVPSSSIALASYAGGLLIGTGEPPPRMIGALELGDSPEKIAANAPKGRKREKVGDDAALAKGDADKTGAAPDLAADTRLRDRDGNVILFANNGDAPPMELQAKDRKPEFSARELSIYHKVMDDPSVPTAVRLRAMEILGIKPNWAQVTMMQWQEKMNQTRNGAAIGAQNAVLGILGPAHDIEQVVLHNLGIVKNPEFGSTIATEAENGVPQSEIIKNTVVQQGKNIVAVANPGVGVAMLGDQLAKDVVTAVETGDVTNLTATVSSSVVGSTIIGGLGVGGTTFTKPSVKPTTVSTTKTTKDGGSNTPKTSNRERPVTPPNTKNTVNKDGPGNRSRGTNQETPPPPPPTSETAPGIHPAVGLRNAEAITKFWDALDSE